MASAIAVCVQCGTIVRPDTHRGSEFARGFLMGAGRAPTWTWAFMGRRPPSCPECGATALVPPDSPMGRKMLAETGQAEDFENTATAMDPPPQSVASSAWGMLNVFGSIVLLFIGVMLVTWAYQVVVGH